MIEKKKTLTWEPYGYVPYGVKETTLFVGKGENLLSFDMDELQHDVETIIHICQDTDGTLHGYIDYDGEIPPYCVARVTIPAGKYEIYDTGEKQKNPTTGKMEPVMAQRKVPVDTENCVIELFGSFFPIEKATDSDDDSKETKED